MNLIRTGRDLRVDFFRGLALWWIFTDHIPADWVNQLSLRNFALCDAAEVFVLLAGYGAGLAYGGRMRRNGWVSAGADVLARAWTLYIAHIFLLVVFVAQVAYSAQALNRTDFIDEIHIDVLGEAPYRAMLEALTLRYQPSFLNILPMYIVVLLMFIPALRLLERPNILAGLSLALYAASRTFGLGLPSWYGGGWYFNPLTWQLLFMLGAILATSPGQPLRRRWPLDVLATLVALFGILMQWVVWQQPELTSHLPLRIARALLSVDKEGLHPFRLVSILALTWLTVRLVPAGAAWLQGRVAAPFILAGQHSLPVFCVGIFLSFLGRLVLESSEAWEAQVAVNVSGALALTAVAALAAWYRAKGAQPRGTGVTTGGKDGSRMDVA